MSYRTWHDYGFGFSFSDFEATCDAAGDPITPEDVERLLAYAPDLRKSIHEWLEELKAENPERKITIDDYREYDQVYSLELAELFAEVVAQAEGLTRVYAVSDYENDHFVIFGQGYPWWMNDREKSLTEEEVEEIFRKYLEILKPATRDKIGVDIEGQSIENGG